MLSSVSNWLCSAYTRQGGGSFGPRRSASRATLRCPQIVSQTVSCPYDMYYSLGGTKHILTISVIPRSKARALFSA